MELFVHPRDTDLTFKGLKSFLQRHHDNKGRYKKLFDYYLGKHSILKQNPKAHYKPDNRLVSNFARHAVDTFDGYFIGKPIKIMHEDKKVSEFLSFFKGYNDLDDHHAEVAKLCSIYGHCFELLYVDEEANLCLTYLSPEEAFIIYDDSVVRRPLYGVRYYYDEKGKLWGSYSDAHKVYYFTSDNGFLKITEEHYHGFDRLPFVEFLQNEERKGAFEGEISLIDAYNRAFSEKANDVDYYADAYLKVLGTVISDEHKKEIRDYRILNFSGIDADKIVVEFMSKPNSDQTQENMLNRLERNIHQLGMVANISDEQFGTTSGIALKYKLLAMENLAAMKERKFMSGLNQRYRIVFSHPLLRGLSKDAWVNMSYAFSRNAPANLLEEANIANQLTSIVTKEKQLSVLSIVDNPKEEAEAVQEENNFSWEGRYEGVKGRLNE